MCESKKQGLEFVTKEEGLKQLHEDCEKLKARNSTPEAETQHETNSCRDYAHLYAYYRGVGCSKKEARKYARWSYDNMVREKCQQKK